MGQTTKTRTISCLTVLFTVAACRSSSSTSGGQDVNTSGKASGPAVKHRAVGTTCPTTRPAVTPTKGGEFPYPRGCAVDADCTKGKNGRCTLHPSRELECDYDQCLSDKDCGGGVCECRGATDSFANVCRGGNCAIDADCKGFACSPSLGGCGHLGGVFGYYCHTAQDQCTNDADCPGKKEGACRFLPTAGAFKCSNEECSG